MLFTDVDCVARPAARDDPGRRARTGKAWRQIRTRYHSRVRLVGFVDDRPVAEMGPDMADRYLGTVDELSELLLRNVVDELLIAVPMKAATTAPSAPFRRGKGGRRNRLHARHVRNNPQANCIVGPRYLHGTRPDARTLRDRQAIKRVIDAVGPLSASACSRHCSPDRGRHQSDQQGARILRAASVWLPATPLPNV